MPLLTLPADRPEPLEAAQRVVALRYASADVVFLGDTVLSAAGTANSDLDLVVIGEQLGAPLRETYIAEGWPVEAFVHDAQTWIAYRDKELRERHPAVTPIVTHGIAVLDRGAAARVRDQAQALFDAGPSALEEGAQERLRYALFNAMLDLEVCAEAGERLAVSYDVVALVADLRCDQAHLWPGRGKRLLRPLHGAQPEMGARIVRAWREAQEGEVAALLEVALETLQSCGGVIYDGYHRAGSRTP